MNVKVTREDDNVRSVRPLITPKMLKSILPASILAQNSVLASRTAVRGVLSGADPRLLAIATVRSSTSAATQI